MDLIYSIARICGKEVEKCDLRYPKGHLHSVSISMDLRFGIRWRWSSVIHDEVIRDSQDENRNPLNYAFDQFWVVVYDTLRNYQLTNWSLTVSCSRRNTIRGPMPLTQTIINLGTPSAE